MRIKQSEVYDEVLVTEFCVFLTSRGTVTDLWFFRAFKSIFQEKKSHQVSRLTIGYRWEEYENFNFSSCATYFRYGSVLVDIPS